MKNIIVPVDFSPNSERALKAAKIIVGKRARKLVIVHAYQPYIPDISIPAAIDIPIDAELESSFREKLRQYVEQAKEEGFEAEALLGIGSVHTVVFDAIQQYESVGVVIGRTGSGGFFDKLIGSAATSIAMDAPCPVLIIPPESKEPEAFKKIVYATQLEYDENHILSEVIPLVNELHGDLTFLKVVAPNQPNIQPDAQFIAHIQEAFGIPDEQFITREASSISEGLSNYCEENDTELLIVSTRQRSFLEAFIINPSVTKKLIVNTHIPLLVYHIKE